ncbi:hypothetical protein A3Q29_09495 [Providencia stuartii]|uniref:Uncharacterized protein n=1 Tax=Providencia stuartii TaxID=588 RepID=A0A1S1HL06_PROST|nr:hypothetical protein A3Q29_09495 [Providencia stuartii]
MDIENFINENYGGNKKKFADACKVYPQQVSKWVKNNNIIIDGVMYSPLREIPIEANEYSRGKTNLSLALSMFNFLKRPTSSFVPEYRKNEICIIADYQFPSRKDKLKDVMHDAVVNVEKTLIALNYLGKCSILLQPIDHPNECYYKVNISRGNNELYIPDLFEYLFVYYLRSKGFNAYNSSKLQLLQMFKQLENLARHLDNDSKSRFNYSQMVAMYKNDINHCNETALLKISNEILDNLLTQPIDN